MPVAGSPAAPVGSGTVFTSPGTPTDSGVCAISPSDLVGYTGNLINRVKDLEQKVAELEAKIVQTSQLSNISQQVGWVGGVTYMGVEGWTQTEYGTLIPPAGFFLGNIIPGLNGGMYDATGTLQLGFGVDGTLSGELAAGLNAPDYLLYDLVYGINESRGITTILNTFSFATVDTGVLTARIHRDGLYLVSAFGDFEISGNVPASTVLNGQTTIQVSGGDLQRQATFDITSINNVAGQNVHPPFASVVCTSAHEIIRCLDNQIVTVGIDAMKFGAAVTFNLSQAHINITYLGSLV